MGLFIDIPSIKALSFIKDFRKIYKNFSEKELSF